MQQEGRGGAVVTVSGEGQRGPVQACSARERGCGYTVQLMEASCTVQGQGENGCLESKKG